MKIDELAVSCACPDKFAGDVIELNLVQGQGTSKEEILTETVRLYWSDTCGYVSMPERED
jgi:hypothetical protein